MTTKHIKCEEGEETESKKMPENYNDVWVASKVLLNIMDQNTQTTSIDT